VTVAMAARNAEEYVEKALASLARQTLEDLEVVVIDDASTDRTSERVRAVGRSDGRIRLRTLRENRGQAAALNLAVAEARGRYLAVLDADDEATEGRLALQVAAFGRDGALVLVGGSVRTYCDHHARPGQVWRYACRDAVIRVRNLFKSEFISGAMCFDLEKLRRHGLGFDPRLKLGTDWDLANRSMRVGEVANVPEVVMHYRIHPGQMTAGMIDDTRSDSARIRVEALRHLGVEPTEEELRTHLAVSPCNYWAFGAHPYFRAARATIARDAARWFGVLLRAARRTRRVPPAELESYLAEIASLIQAELASDELRELAAFCPVSAPWPCLKERPCR